MARLLYSAIMSLDGFIDDADGRFDWSTPDEQTHAFINELQRPVGTYLLGRRMHDVLLAWERMTDDELDRMGSPAMRDYADQWRRADKVVYSRTRAEVEGARTWLEKEFGVERVERLVRESARDVLIGGADLAGQALRAGLVDEVHLFVCPVLVGAGTRALSPGVRSDLVLAENRPLSNGVVYSAYQVVRPA